LGATLNVNTPQPAAVAPVIKIANRLPSAWGGYAGASVIPKSNDDSYADFVVGEFATGKPGRVVIFH
jgi:hypothetical protein